MSPEMLNNEGYYTKCDVWSIGCVMAELMTGRHTVPTVTSMDDLRRYFREPRRIHLPKRFDKNLRYLVQQCFRHDPVERPTCRQLLESVQAIAWTRSQRVSTRPVLSPSGTCGDVQGKTRMDTRSEYPRSTVEDGPHAIDDEDQYQKGRPL